MNVSNECSIWVGVTQHEEPSYETGRYWYKLQHSTIYIRQFEKPSWLKRICMKVFFGVEFIDTLIAYRPKGGITRYVRTVEHFHNSFKEIKPEYEYQWLLKTKESNERN